jgi:hypothetical protein
MGSGEQTCIDFREEGVIFQQAGKESLHAARLRYTYLIAMQGGVNKKDANRPAKGHNGYIDALKINQTRWV